MQTHETSPGFWDWWKKKKTPEPQPEQPRIDIPDDLPDHDPDEKKKWEEEEEERKKKDNPGGVEKIDLV